MTTAEAEIAATNQAFSDAISARDAAGVSAVYTADGQVLPTGAPEITGPADVQAFWQAQMDGGLCQAKLTTVELRVYDDHAVEHGRFELFDKNNAPVDNGKFIVIWANENGQWKWRLDIFNSSVAA